MDIDLLSRMVKELILESDEVALPGVGCFVAELVPSTFSDKGYTINPPYRRLYFRQRQEGNDTSLARLYASSNNVEFVDAEKIVGSFLTELKEVLLQKKTVVFPGLGRLRATKENNFFFVPDEDLDIYPAGFGLEPLSLKTHEETPEEVSDALDGFKAIIDNSAPSEETPARQEYASPETALEEQPAPEQPAAQDTELPAEPVQAMPRPVRTHSHSSRGRKKTSAGKVLLIILIVLILIAALAFVAFMICARVAPDWLDTLLYTPEQLEIIHGRLPL